MGDELTSNEKEARFWDLYRTYYAFARTFGRLKFSNVSWCEANKCVQTT